MAQIGIRREDKYPWERRVPLAPHQVAALVSRGVSVVVQPSVKRIFEDADYAAAGARIADDLTGSNVILGVKEIPPELLHENQAYLYFSHVIKAQEYNMPMLARLLDLDCTLMDYELITNDEGRRLVFFGEYAGYAGMVDAFWTLGRRLRSEGYETPFAQVDRGLDYPSLDDAEAFLGGPVAAAVRQGGLPEALHPMVFGFTGGGNVSRGAQRVFDHLPFVEVAPEDLPGLAQRPDLDRNVLYKVVFRRDDRVDFERHLPHLTVLVNGIYWEEGHPRLVTRDALQKSWRHGNVPKLRVLADLSCDIRGSIEATVRATTIADPVFVYDPFTDESTSGVEGHGPVVLAVDILPAEFPRDASIHFGDSLAPFLEALAGADYSASFDNLSLPPELLRAVIAHGGALTPSFEYLQPSLALQSA